MSYSNSALKDFQWYGIKENTPNKAYCFVGCKDNKMCHKMAYIVHALILYMQNSFVLGKHNTFHLVIIFQKY